MSAPKTLAGHAKVSRFQLYRSLVNQDLRLRVLGSKLGLLWLALQPLLYLAFMTVVFFGVLEIRFGQGGLSSYVWGLLGGLVAWLGFNECLPKAATSLIERAHLVRSIPLPKAVIPLVPLAGALAYQGICLLVLAVVSAARGSLGPQLFLLVPGVLLEALFLAGVCWTLAALTVVYRDLLYLLNFALMAWLYLTPIFYPAHVVPGGLAPYLVYLNPLSLLVVIFRGALFGETIPWSVWPTLAQLSALMALAGYLLFRRIENALVDLL